MTFPFVGNARDVTGDGVDGWLSPLDLAGVQTIYGFNSDNGNRQVWYSSGSVPDYGPATEDRLMFQAKSFDTISGDVIPVIGNFDGFHGDDILMYGPGSATDFKHFSIVHRERRFGAIAREQRHPGAAREASLGWFH